MYMHGMGDIWSDIGTGLQTAMQTGASVFNTIEQSNAVQSLAARGILPSSFAANGTPVYASTPAGVTPSNPFSLPSGYALPAGVTPAYIQQPAPQSLTSELTSGNMLLYLLLGGGAILLLALALK